jgi:hypothetical protein
MSEKKYAHHSHEHARGTDEVQDTDSEKLKELIEQGRDARHEHAEKLDEIRNEAKAEAKPRDEVLAGHNREKEPEAPSGMVNRELKDMAYSRTLTRIRKDLPLPERAFSKVIHNKTIDSLSEAGSKTIARPSGILAGGFFAFLGSSVFLWISKHYGYEYNFLLFALLFAAGFALGLAIELLFRLGRRT